MTATADTNPPRLDDQRLSALGLDRQPFEDTDFTYTDDDLDTRLNIAVGVLRSTAAVVLVSGVEGVGKTTFLGQLAAMDEGLVMAGVTATAEMRLADILQAIGARGGETVVSAAARSVRECRGRLVLTVDEAERLPPQTLVQIAGLQGKLAEQGLELPVVLACEREAARSAVEAIEPHLTEASPLHEVVLGGFGVAETRAYLRQRLTHAGAGGALLDDRQIERIHARSEGIPARINAEAARELDQAPKKPFASVSIPGGWWRMALIAGVPVVVTVAVAVGLLADEDTPERVVTEAPAPVPAESGPSPTRTGETSDSDDTASPAAPAGTDAAGGADTPDTAGTRAPGEDDPTPATEPENGDTGAIAGNGEPASTADAVDTLASDAAGTEAGGPATEAAEPSAEAPAAREPDDAGERDADPASAPDPVASGNAGDTDGEASGAAASDDAPASGTDVSEDAASQSDVATDRTGAPEDGGSAPPPDGRVATSEGDWLAARDSRHYTIQILGAYETETVARFRDRIDGGEAVRTVRTTRDGQDWYVMVTGDYASLEGAREAIADLPETWRANGAFARSFASLKP